VEEVLGAAESYFLTSYCLLYDGSIYLDVAVGQEVTLQDVDAAWQWKTKRRRMGAG
jgi:hypothetical protein